MRNIITNNSVIEKKVNSLPPYLIKEVEDFIDFIASKHDQWINTQKGKNKKQKFNFRWEGALAEFKGKYNSVELQHKANEWRNS